MATIHDLPGEVLRSIALSIYNPLELTQQDRLSESLPHATGPSNQPKPAPS